MVSTDFINDLSPWEQAIIKDYSMSMEEKLEALGYAISDETVLEKCKKHLEFEEKLEEYLEKVPDEHKETVKGIVTDDVLLVAEKFAALQLVWDDRDFLAKSYAFMRNSKPVKEKNDVRGVPAIMEIPFLSEIPEEIREELKNTISNTILTIERKLERIDELVTEKTLKKKCKRFLKKLQKEIRFLSQFPAENRVDVAAIVRETALTLTEKSHLLRYALKKSEDRKKCREYMRDNEPIPDYEEDDSLPDLNLDFLEKAPDVMNILILGETGVGKSTFINGMANYLKYRNMHAARSNNGLEILITSYFTHTDENQKIISPADDHDGNEDTTDGTSSTLAAKTYVFKWGPENNEKKICLIDTPGVGDVAGFEKDRQNFDNIFSHLADYKELHGICVLLKPNESKLNTTFTYCLGELLSRLHKSALKNLLFCFTNTRNTLYRPGETIAILAPYLKKIEETRKIQVPLNRASLFCFDNESFRFLCAWKEGVKFSERHIEDFNGSWKRSVEEIFRFFNRISQLRAHTVADTLCVNNVRTVYNILARPMTDLHGKQKTIDKVIEEKNAEITKLQNEIAVLTPKLSRSKKTNVRRATNRVDTVCSSANCCQFDTLNANERRYRVCHNACTCVRAKLETCQEVKLQQCTCINKQTLTCSCGCLWLTHMQINHELVAGVENVVDIAVENKIQTLKAQQDQVITQIAAAQQRKNVAGTDNQKLVDQGAEFVAYLMKNAVLPYNTHKKDYLEKLIKEEKQNVGQGKSDKNLLALEHYQEEHAHQASLLDACKEDSRKTEEEMNQLIADIKDSKEWGSIQSDIDKMIILKPRSRPMIRSRVVDLNEGWIGEHLEKNAA